MVLAGMMQRVLAFGALVLLAAALLVGCGAAADAEPARSVATPGLDGGTGNAAAQRELGAGFGEPAAMATLAPVAAAERMERAAGGDFGDAMARAGGNGGAAVDAGFDGAEAAMAAGVGGEGAVVDRYGGAVVGGDGGAAAGAAGGTLQVAERRVVATASLTIETAAVERAAERAGDIAESMGGFVERLSSAGGSEPPQAELTLRVPQGQFGTALERLETLGEVQFRTLGREDVTERFIDLAARLRSASREEESLLGLLERSGSVLEVVSVERELARVRAEVERLQGQLNFLERRVDLATIYLTLRPPGRIPTDPPIANFTLAVSGVDDKVAELKSYVAEVEGEIDEVHWLTYEDGERANVTFRVYAGDFAGTTAFVEEQGRVSHRELREGVNLAAGEDEPKAKRPDARLVVSYVDADFDFQPWLAVVIVVGVLVLAGGMAFLARYAYRLGRIRGRFF